MRLPEGVIRSKRHELVKHFFWLQNKASYRKRQGKLVVPGQRLVDEFGKSHRFDRVLTIDKERSYNAEKIIPTTSEVLQELMWKVSEDAEAIGELSLPPPVDSTSTERPFRRILALDRIKFPVNIAMLANSAYVLQCSHIFFLNESCDPFNWKVLQQSRVTGWRLPYLEGSEEDLLALCKKHELLPLVAEKDGIPVEKIADHRGDNGICVILGCEYSGVSEALRDASLKISVPMSEMVESLNVSIAGSIILQQLL